MFFLGIFVIHRHCTLYTEQSGMSDLLRLGRKWPSATFLMRNQLFCLGDCMVMSECTPWQDCLQQPKNWHPHNMGRKSNSLIGRPDKRRCPVLPYAPRLDLNMHTLAPYNLKSLRASSNSLLDAVCACTQTIWDVPIFAEFPGAKTTIFFSFVLTLDWPKPSPPKKKTGWCFHILFSYRYLGRSSKLTHIFQMGWNHQQKNNNAKASIPLQELFESTSQRRMRLKISKARLIIDFVNFAHRFFTFVTYTYLTNG